MLGLLVDKGWLKLRRDGKRYLYRPAISKERSQRNALRRMLGNLFGSSPDDAMAAMLEMSASEMIEQQWDRITQMIEKTRKENQRR